MISILINTVFCLVSCISLQAQCFLKLIIFLLLLNSFSYLIPRPERYYSFESRAVTSRSAANLWLPSTSFARLERIVSHWPVGFNNYAGNYPVKFNTKNRYRLWTLKIDRILFLDYHVRNLAPHPFDNYFRLANLYPAPFPSINLLFLIYLYWSILIFLRKEREDM